MISETLTLKNIFNILGVHPTIGARLFVGRRGYSHELDVNLPFLGHRLSYTTKPGPCTDWIADQETFEIMKQRFDEISDVDLNSIRALSNELYYLEQQVTTDEELQKQRVLLQYCQDTLINFCATIHMYRPLENGRLQMVLKNIVGEDGQVYAEHINVFPSGEQLKLFANLPLGTSFTATGSVHSYTHDDNEKFGLHNLRNIVILK